MKITNSFRFGLNFSFEAILLMYINRISNPPMNIKNIIIEIQDLKSILEISIVEIIVWISRKLPMLIGVLRNIIKVEIPIKIFIRANLIPTNNLMKILVLGIKNVNFYHFVEVLKVTPNFSLQD
jgi:hypothetical protein